MTRYFCAVICLTFLVSATSIASEITWGKSFQDGRRSQLGGFIGKTDSHIYMLRFDTDGPIISVLNDSGNLSQNIELPLKYKDKEMLYEGVFMLDDSIVLLSSFYNQKQKMHYLFYQSLSVHDWKSGGLKKLVKVPDISRKSTVYFDHDHSSDGSKIIIYTSINIHNGPIKFGFTVLDRSMQKIWSKNVLSLNDLLFFNPVQIEVSNSGDVVIAGYLDEEGDGKKEYHILLYKYLNGYMKDYVLDLDDLEVHQMTFLLDSIDNLRCAGLYSQPDKESLSGTFYIEISTRDQVIKHKHYQPFESSFIAGASDTIQSKIVGEDFKHYRIRDLKLSRTGGTVLIAEQYYIQVDRADSYNMPAVRSSRAVTNYFFNDIIVFGLNTDGSVEWQSKIRKKQHSTDDGGYFSSFSTYVYQGKLSLFYNEPANRFYSENRYKTLEKDKKKDMYLIEVRLDSNGTFRKEILLEQTKLGVRIRPKVCEQISPDTSILYGKWNRSQRFGIMRHHSDASSNF